MVTEKAFNRTTSWFVLELRVTRVVNKKDLCKIILAAQTEMVVALFHKSNSMHGCTFINKSHREKDV